MSCWRCAHEKSEHFRSGSYSELIICFRCAPSTKSTTFYTKEWVETDLWYHEFEDNLSYIERLAKEKNLL